MTTAESSRKQPLPSVLLVDLGAHFGGVENYLINLASLLQGHLQVYALCVLPALAARLAAHGVRVIRLPVFPGPLKPLRFLAAFLLLPVLLFWRRIQIVQVNGLLESLLIFAARAIGRQAVYTRHGPFETELYSWRRPLKRVPRELARLSSRFATHVVCVSQTVAETVRPLVPENRFSVISNWVPTQDPFSPPDQRPSPRVLCAARLEPYKGVHLLLEAARQLPQLELTIVGEGSCRAALERSAGDLPWVRFAGFQPEMAPFYAAADIFVMPSLGPEGLPMTSLEAMSHGIPCILSDLLVHREITDEGLGGYLFRSGESRSLVDGLRALCASPELRRTYAEQAWRIVDARYTEKRVRAAYLRVLGAGGPAHA